jgi:hypothetical protein
MLATILAKKGSILCQKDSYGEGSYEYVFSYLESTQKKKKIELEKIFCFRLIMGFKVIFYVFEGHRLI